VSNKYVDSLSLENQLADRGHWSSSQPDINNSILHHSSQIDMAGVM